MRSVDAADHQHQGDGILKETLPCFREYGRAACLLDVVQVDPRLISALQQLLISHIKRWPVASAPIALLVHGASQQLYVANVGLTRASLGHLLTGDAKTSTALWIDARSQVSCGSILTRPPPSTMGYASQLLETLDLKQQGAPAEPVHLLYITDAQDINPVQGIALCGLLLEYEACYCLEDDEVTHGNNLASQPLSLFRLTLGSSTGEEAQIVSSFSVPTVSLGSTVNAQALEAEKIKKRMVGRVESRAKKAAERLIHRHPEVSSWLSTADFTASVVAITLDQVAL